MGQLLLIPDPRPLDERLGDEFFRTAPQRPGVYLMRDAAENVLYVGKAKSLRRRLGNYRIANPDRMPRRHLRMLRQVARIEFQFCTSEAAALSHETRLIRSLKPRFNRAGVWPGKPRFIVWRLDGNRLELSITEVPHPAWQRFGPVGASSHQLHKSLAQMLWLALNPNRSCMELPHNWGKGEISEQVELDCRESATDVSAALVALFWGESERCLTWIEARLCSRTHPFERNVISSHLEVLKGFASKQRKASKHGPQLALL